MNATATMIDTGPDGCTWFAVSFSPVSQAEDSADLGDETYGLAADGAILDADGCPVVDFANARNIAARNAIQAAQ